MVEAIGLGRSTVRVTYLDKENKGRYPECRVEFINTKCTFLCMKDVIQTFLTDSTKRDGGSLKEVVATHMVVGAPWTSAPEQE